MVDNPTSGYSKSLTKLKHALIGMLLKYIVRLISLTAWEIYLFLTSVSKPCKLGQIKLIKLLTIN